jgi:hypothetical protein
VFMSFQWLFFIFRLGTFSKNCWAYWILSLLTSLVVHRNNSKYSTGLLGYSKSTFRPGMLINGKYLVPNSVSILSLLSLTLSSSCESMLYWLLDSFHIHITKFITLLHHMHPFTRSCDNFDQQWFKFRTAIVYHAPPFKPERCNNTLFMFVLLKIIMSVVVVEL